MTEEVKYVTMKHIDLILELLKRLDESVSELKQRIEKIEKGREA